MADGGIRPTYYGGPDDPYEPVKVIRNWDLGFNTGNVLKYIKRSVHKERVGDWVGEIEDLRKARTYLDIEIKALEDQGDEH